MFCRRTAHMRVERVVLEHHGDVLFGGQAVDPLVADEEVAEVIFQPGDLSRRGLAAARRADQHDEFRHLIPVDDGASADLPLP